MNCNADVRSNTRAKVNVHVIISIWVRGRETHEYVVIKQHLIIIVMSFYYVRPSRVFVERCYTSRPYTCAVVKFGVL